MQVFLCQEGPEDCSGNPRLLDINVFGANQAFYTALIFRVSFYSWFHSQPRKSYEFSATLLSAPSFEAECFISELEHHVKSNGILEM